MDFKIAREAITNDDINALYEYIALGGDVNIREDGTHKTLLMYAAQGNKKDFVDLLIQHKACVNMVEDLEYDRFTAIHYATHNDDPGASDIIVSLIEANADIHCFTRSRSTPLSKAIANGRTGSVKVLLYAGAKMSSLSHRTYMGQYVLYGAMKASHQKCKHIISVVYAVLKRCEYPPDLRRLLYRKLWGMRFEFEY